MSEDLGEALSNTIDSDNNDEMTDRPMADYDLAQLLGELVETWTAKCPSMRRVYLFFGYDDYLNIGDGMAICGCRYRVMKTDSGNWRAVNIAYWKAWNRGRFSHLYHPFDSLPGIIDNDLDPFEEVDCETYCVD